MRVLTSLLVLLAAPSPPAAAAIDGDCPAGARPLLILGTFHMEGSSGDAVDAAVGDMSTPRRQAEISELVDRLARFRPTVIAIESSRISSYWNDRYRAWLTGEQALGGNEIEQIGFRLAKQAGVAALAPVDYPMWMDGSQAIDRHEPRSQPESTGRADADPPLLAGIRAQVAADDARLRDGSVREFLAWLNRPDRAVLNHRWDVISNLAPADGTSRYEHTDLATNWYKRNLRIYTNLVDVAGPTERVLLLIGAGHTHLLRSLAVDDPRFCVADAARYLD